MQMSVTHGNKRVQQFQSFSDKYSEQGSVVPVLQVYGDKLSISHIPSHISSQISLSKFCLFTVHIVLSYYSECICLLHLHCFQKKCEKGGVC